MKGAPEQEWNVAADETPQHQGGFRADFEVTTERGGPSYGEMIEQVRTFMDKVRYASPSPELADEVIDDLRKLNAKLDSTLVDEWTSPSGTRIDLPSRGNITLPPYEVLDGGPDGVDAVVTFRPFHLGGNGVAHGGHVAIAFDDLGGMAAALRVGRPARTAYLTVNYRSLTPLDTPLTLRTWVERHDGRKNFVRGTLHDGDRLCAELDSLFIELKPGQA
ncbi:PaaI family thioesterase [Gordonia neofelifaecis]|uniref:Acyl-coenzyme A thioesterase THEM4 n=1 Tax=Gordonia neofelifaecis NRRL B-59395 TaxID=644548 RepID=F1YIM2_9ACTN|nr:PaaI family thioesterase [Gordonia neofelifaecis]EGD55330.1 thioesterase superfamily protein [Gordonia neofelifaecis NRRL B-59395]